MIFGNRFLDLAGKQFGLLKVAGHSHKVKTKHFWLCDCLCGNQLSVSGEHLKQGRVVSCGCRKKANASSLGRQNLAHGESSSGGTRQPSAEYRAWKSMKHRCLNPKHKSFRDYGGRGISICQEWIDSFESFLACVGRKPTAKHSLDRFPDPDGNYEPDNVRWATASEQQRNKRPRPQNTQTGSPAADGIGRSAPGTRRRGARNVITGFGER